MMMFPPFCLLLLLNPASSRQGVETKMDECMLVNVNDAA